MQTFIILIVLFNSSVWASNEIALDDNSYQLEFNESSALDLETLLPEDTELLIYNHCLTAGTSSHGESNEHVDLFANSKSGHFAPLWITGMHSNVQKEKFSGGSFCSSKTISINKPPQILSVFTSSGSHYEIGLRFKNSKYQNIARAGFDNYFKKIETKSPFLFSNNLFAKLTHSQTLSENQIFLINFTNPIDIENISIPIRNTDTVTYKFLVNGTETTETISSSMYFKYLTRKNISKVSSIKLVWNSEVTTAEVFTRPLMIWVKKSLISN
ncbi:hypothetical protein [Candidatus Puniceispirillum marinum]|uniref:hypothetical protein n=1 Tax=Candidatus Puniceispirillum marinum TaxID=767892 RepID=UPI0011D14104|nr:hypothetical protein [Candidatus Puniceispirillum marinum]